MKKEEKRGLEVNPLEEILKIQLESLPSTSDQFVKDWNPRYLSRKLKGVGSHVAAYKANTPRIGLLVKKYGEDATEAIVILFLMDLNLYVNAKMKLNEIQMDQCSMLLVQNYKNLTMADLNLIFTMAKSGEFGEFYENISVPKVMKWFKKYFEDRCEAIAISNQINGSKGNIGGKRSYSEKMDLKKGFDEFSHNYNLDKFKEKYNGTKE